MAKTRTDKTMAKRRTDKTMAKRRTDKTMAKERTDFNGQNKDRQHSENGTSEWY
jgi:hypothetical protein